MGIYITAAALLGLLTGVIIGLIWGLHYKEKQEKLPTWIEEYEALNKKNK
jgi:TctA family transporter